MASGECHRLTFSELLVAFLELVLAYFLLCGSAFVFLASKFLLVFGLYLPCPCTGIFGYRNRDLCLHKLLFDWPLRKIYTIQRLARSTLPFQLVWRGNHDRNSKLMLVNDNKCENGELKIEDQTCSSSFSGSRIKYLADKESECDPKGKRIGYLKQKGTSRRRRRAAVGYGKSSLAPLDGNTQSDNENGAIGTDTNDTNDTSWPGVETKVSSHGDANEKEDLFSIKKSMCNAEVFESEASVVNMLEQALEEEKAARAALYLELEKERAAAATAADEAMAMILRLQADKASLEMEAKQYERMMEEKFVYDEEEMNILKEIIVRRERDNHFLEKELESYKLMEDIPGNDLSDGHLNEYSPHRDGLRETTVSPSLISEGVSPQAAQTDSSAEKSLCFGDKEPIVYDVHVIEDKTEFFKKGNGRENESCNGEKPGSDCATEQLRELLSNVQKEKERSIYSVEYKERVSAQLKLVEEIVNQLREIEQLREPVKHDALPSSSHEA